MTKEELLNSGLLDEYVLGLCTEETREEIERLASQDEEVAKILAEMQSGMKDYCRKSVSSPFTHRSTSDQIQSQTFWKMVAGATMTTTVVLALLSIHFYSKTQELRSDHSQFLTVLESDREQWEKKLNASSQIHSRHQFVTHEQTRQIQMAGGEKMQEARMIVYWNDVQQDAVLHIFKLPSVPDGWCYKLWADVDGKMMDMGLIKSTESWLEIPYFSNVSGLNVTLEEHATSHAPNVERILCKAKI
ncbi:MAG: anti-sigma factor [Saprospiraceae bacterium]|nr:anti-sigma factor [Saprospiraceae bacterium]